MSYSWVHGQVGDHHTMSAPLSNLDPIDIPLSCYDLHTAYNERLTSAYLTPP